MGGFLTGFFNAGGNEALGEKHRHEEYNEAYRQANLANLLRMREIAAQNGASQDILDQFNKSIGELQPGHHPSAPTPVQQTQTAIPSLTLPGQTNVPLIGESPNTDITGNTPHANAPADTSAPQAAPTPQLTPVAATTPQPGVFMKGGAIPKPAAADNTPIIPPAVTASTPPVTIPGQAGPTVTNAPMTLSRAMAEANDPRFVAMKQAYAKQIEAQAAYQQQISQFQQTMDNLEPMLKKAGIPDDQIAQIKRDAAIQQFSPRAFMMYSRVPHLSSSGALDVQGAIAEQERTGTPFYDSMGQPIDLGFMQQNFPNAQLNPVIGPGGNQYWEVGTQPTKTTTFNNQVTQIPSRGIVTPQNENPLGQKQVATTTTRQVPSAGGGVLTLNSTRTPQTPAPKTQSTIANPGGAPQLKNRNGQTVSDYQGNPVPTDAVTTPQTTESGAPAPKGTASAKTPNRKKVGDFVRQANDSQLLKQAAQQGIEPDMSKLYANQGVAARKALPAVVALRGVFGDPERPELPTISDFSDLANDPHAQARLGEAFTLLMQRMGVDAKNPAGLVDGFTSSVAAAGGFQNWQAKIQAEVAQNALNESNSTPRERSYFNAAVNAMADIIGARSATGANAAQWSVDAIQNELPLIGLYGANTQKDYLQKLMSLNSTLGNVINTMPDNGRARAWLKKREGDLVQQQKNAQPAQQPNKTISMDAINRAAKDHGISADEAKKQAEAQGYHVQ